MVPATRLGLRPLLLLILLGAGVELNAAQTPPQSPPVQSPAAPAAPAQSTPKPTVELPSDLARVKQGVLAQRTFTLFDRETMRIYVDTVAPFPKFLDIVGDFNLRVGGVPHSGMTHQEFVQSTRPKDMYSSAGLGIGDMTRFALLSYAEGKAFELLRKAAVALRNAKTEADRKAIQMRIERELAALKGGGDIK